MWELCDFTTLPSPAGHDVQPTQPSSMAWGGKRDKLAYAD